MAASSVSNKHNFLGFFFVSPARIKNIGFTLLVAM